MKIRREAIGVFAALFAARAAEAAVVTLGAAKDNTLYQDAAGSLSNGSGEFFFAGNTGNGVIRRGLTMFDLGAIAPGSTINSVSLTLHMSMTSAGATDVSLHTLLANWGEGASDAPGGEGAGVAAAVDDATWLHTSFNTGFWTNAGGDFAASSSAATSVNAVGFYTWSSSQMAADVQQWVDSPGANFGWLLQGNESASNTSKRFDTRENATLAFRPTLVVDYTPIPAPGGLALVGVGLLTRRSRRR